MPPPALSLPNTIKFLVATTLVLLTESRIEPHKSLSGLGPASGATPDPLASAIKSGIRVCRLLVQAHTVYVEFVKTRGDVLCAACWERADVMLWFTRARAPPSCGAAGWRPITLREARFSPPARSRTPTPPARRRDCKPKIATFQRVSSSASPYPILCELHTSHPRQQPLRRDLVVLGLLLCLTHPRRSRPFVHWAQRVEPVEENSVSRFR